MAAVASVMVAGAGLMLRATSWQRYAPVDTLSMTRVSRQSVIVARSLRMYMVISLISSLLSAPSGTDVAPDEHRQGLRRDVAQPAAAELEG